jgi:hypothetical protein
MSVCPQKMNSVKVLCTVRSSHLHLINLPTPQNRTILEKLTVTQILKKLPILWILGVHYCVHKSFPPEPDPDTYESSPHPRSLFL